MRLGELDPILITRLTINVGEESIKHSRMRQILPTNILQDTCPCSMTYGKSETGVPTTIASGIGCSLWCKNHPVQISIASS